MKHNSVIITKGPLRLTLYSAITSPSLHVNTINCVMVKLSLLIANPLEVANYPTCPCSV